jgi:hypothetical protein
MHVWPRRAHASHHIALVMCTISPPLLRALCTLTLAVSDAATCDSDFSSNNCEGVCTIMSMECSAFTACVASMHYQENGFAGVSTCQNEPVLLQASQSDAHARPRYRTCLFSHAHACELVFCASHQQNIHSSSSSLLARHASTHTMPRSI